MANTYSALYYHVVFGTKNREPSLKAEVRERVWQYMGGIASENGMAPIEIGGVADHAHVLMSVPPMIRVTSTEPMLSILITSAPR